MGDTPTTWIWSRLLRTRSTRRGVRQREHRGYLIGGYRTLLDAMASRIEGAGGAIRPRRTSIRQLVGGHHLVYMPKYVAPGSRWLDAPADEIAAALRDDLYRMVPAARAARER